MSLPQFFQSLFVRSAQKRRLQSRQNANAVSVEHLESRQLLTLIGMTATVNNTAESTVQTGGVEVPVGSPVSAIVIDGGTEAEFTSGSYSIDIDASTVAMRFNGAASSTSTLPTGSFDRYYIKFNLASNESLSSATSDPAASLQPTLRIQGGDTLMVELGPGTTVGSGQDALLNVQVARTGTVITGRKFHDVNGDSRFNPGENWLNGWEVNLVDLNQNSSVVATTMTTDIDLNGDGQIDPRSERGVYEFIDQPAGTYLVQEVQRPGWDATLPTAPEIIAAYDLNESVNLTSAGRSFLNWGGLQEKWLYGSGSWYFITPTGTVSQWDGSPRTNLTGIAVAELTADYYNDLTRLTNAASPRQYVVDIDASANQTDRGLDFGNFLAPPAFTVTENANNTVTLEWPQTTAFRYDVWITDINTGRRFEVTEGIPGSTVLPVSSFTSNVLPDRRYRVWMRTQVDAETYSPWSASQEFEFTRDALPAPITAGLEAGIDATPTLTIAPQDGAISYDVQVTDNAGNVVYHGNGAATQRITRRLSRGNYSVAVRANYADGSRTAFSAGQAMFIGGRPAVAIGGNQISWTAINGATEYDLWIDRIDEQGTRIAREVVRLENLQNTTYQPALRPGNYTVWVRAIRSEDGTRYPSFWSFQTFFSVESNRSLLPQTPAENATTTTALTSGGFVQAARAVATATQQIALGGATQVNDVMAEIAVSGMLNGIEEE